MKRLICMMGLPRSGKSTLTARLRQHLGAPVVNADAVRLALHGQRYVGIAEPFVKAIRQLMVRALFIAGHDVLIYDETNWNREIRDRMKCDEWQTLYYELTTPVSECRRRALACGQPDLLPVIENMHARYEPLGYDELRYKLPFEL